MSQAHKEEAQQEMPQANAECRPAECHPDEILVVSAIIGDLNAFDELITRYRSAVVRIAQIIVGQEDAEDVAQDALLLAFKALPSIEHPEQFGSWLMTITRHRAFRHNKQKSSHRKKLMEFDKVMIEQIHALQTPFIEKIEENEELKLALDNMPSEYALVLRLRYWDDMPLQRIASFLGVPISTIKWRIFRGKQVLRTQIETLRNGEILWKENKK